MRGPGRRNIAKSALLAGEKDDTNVLFAAITSLKSPGEAARFLRDLATPAEIETFAERWRIARLLDAGALSYRDIAAETGASTTTVARVARFLREEANEGYRLVLDRMSRRRK